MTTVAETELQRVRVWCSRIFYPTLKVQLNQLLHHTPKLEVLSRAC